MLRVPLVVAGTEVRRTGRVVAGNRTKVLTFLAVALVAVGPITAIGLLVLPTLGEALAAGNVDPPGNATPTDVATGATALVWMFLAGLAAMRTTTNVADVDEPASLLVSTSLRNVVAGLLAAELALFAVWIVPPLLLLAGAFSYGFGSVLPVVLATVVVATLLVSAIPVGFVVGVWIRHLLTVYEPIARHRTPIFVVVAVAYVGAVMTGWIGEFAESLFFLLTDSPLGWPGHLLLAIVPGVSPSAGAVLGAAVGTLVVTGLGIEAGVRSASVHWFAVPVRSDDETERPTESETADRLLPDRFRRGPGARNVVAHRLPVGGIDRRVRTVTATAIRRTKRAPARLLYVAYPLFGALFFLEQPLRTGTVPAGTAVLFCGYVVWGSGAVLALNPLGDPGRGLPAVLTATVSGRDVVGGLVLASTVVSAPVAIAVSLAVGVASPLSLETTGVLLGGTVAGTVVAPLLATGVGCAFPRFGSVRVTNNREAIVPSKTAFVVYTLALAAPAAAATVLYVDGAPAAIAGVLSALVSLAPWFDVTIPSGAVTAVSWIVLLLGLVAPPASARYAIRRLDRYALE